MSNNKAFKVKNGLELEAYSKVISATAVDVFVYDTSKDSDGGAWRKRTQATSWYNETLNTATRGGRKEFPAVAVIVAESDKVTIYDGDDPDLPMWMVFNVAGGAAVVNMIGNQTGVGRSVVMLNGQLSVGADGGYTSTALHVVDFIADTGRSYTISTSYNGDWPSNISTRNTQQTFIANSAYIIVAVQVNDVAMTVLPNAPIDAATGLPVPTIAVATNGGVSVIKDDGTVVDSASTLGAQQITFDLYDGLYWVRNTTTGIMYYASLGDYSGGDGFGDEIGRTSIGTNDIDLLTWLSSGTNMLDANGPYLAHGGAADTGSATSGVALYDFDTSNFPARTNALITSDYNTGWMNGDIKLATLSDTDATNVTGAELNTDPNFDSGVGIFTAATGTVTHSSGTITSTKNSGGNSAMTSSAVLTVGKAYYIEFEVTAVSPSYTHINSPIGEITSGQVGTHSGTFIAGSTTVDFGQNNGGSTSSVTFTRISIRLAEEDRSVNGKGLQVFGTVTKSAVATGAELVAYSGWSGSKYLQQPYNSDLDFTDTMFVSVWVKDVTSAFNVFDRGTRYTDHSYGLYLRDAQDDIRFYYSSNGTTDNLIEVSGGGALLNSGWHHIAVSVNSGNVGIYVDGVLKTTGTLVGNFYSQATSQKPLTVGAGSVSANDGGSIALLRISATAPSPQQILKIYNDEKFLFQEGAQATLYGSSDAVTALAYDDSTNLLHVGTSAGRSVFQGLRRVSNTTTAVGTAISASNGLVVEE